MKTWDFISSSLSSGLKTMLLFVVESQGSSPGRRGFCLAVNEQEKFCGTIGGGIMEVKLLELAKRRLLNNEQKGIIKQQFHDKKKTKNRSGLICSGHQVVCLLPIDETNAELIDTLKSSDRDIQLTLTQFGISESNSKDFNESMTITSEESFECFVRVKRMPRVHVFGAGHVGVALSNQMNLLGYKVKLYDNRADLNTMQSLHDEVSFEQIDYNKVSEDVRTASMDYAIMVSYSYTDDKTLIKQLYNMPFAYIGMMGSDAKIAQLKSELEEEGIRENMIKHVHTPIGMPIYSKTAEEIAVSIAAQIIAEKNRNLPTGRHYKA